MVAKLCSALSLPAVFLIEGIRSSFLMLANPLLLICLFILHEPVIKALRSIQKRISFVSREQSALTTLPSGSPPNWMRTDEDHPFDSDLNISGEKGLFVFISRCLTRKGQRLLHRWLLEGVGPETLLERQEALRELGSMFGFREAFLSSEVDGSEKQGQDSRLDEEINGIPHEPLVSHYVFILPLMTLSAVVFGLLQGIWSIFFLLFLGQIFLNFFSFSSQQFILNKCRGVWREIRQYRRILIQIENAGFRSDRLSSLQKKLFLKGARPSRVLKTFERALQCLELRGSAIHPLVNNILLWDLFWIVQLQIWISEWKENFIEWLDVCAEIEALASVASLAFNHPDWAFPEFVDEPLFIEIEGLGHPLLSTASQSVNPCIISGPHHLCFISGPNMAGKSTYLRSVGLAIVMAQAGMPVCAKGMKLGRLSLVSSLSHSDSLAEGKSLFHKELDRLVKIWTMCNAEDRAIFFLVDEMLRGTNPVDRFNGSYWVLKLLARRKAVGIVATHDLRLCGIEDPENPVLSIQNHHFSCRISTESCLFDYRLNPGTAPSVNAIPLMRQRGLPIPDFS